MQEVTLCLLRRDEELLLIEKLRGLGEGLVNAPGGKVEPGERPREAAVREVHEEVSLTVDPATVERSAELLFVLDGTPHSRCHVFTGTSFAGDPSASSEARPMWVPISEIPYDQM